MPKADDRKEVEERRMLRRIPRWRLVGDESKRERKRGRFRGESTHLVTIICTQSDMHMLSAMKEQHVLELCAFDRVHKPVYITHIRENAFLQN